MKASFLRFNALVRTPGQVEETPNSYRDLQLRLNGCRAGGSKALNGASNLVSFEVGNKEHYFRGRFDIYAPPGKLH
jgi:hypothetical protein